MSDVQIARSPGAEAAVCGMLAQNPQSFDLYAGQLTDEAFTDTTWRAVWRAMVQLHEEGRVWTWRILHERVTANNGGEPVQGLLSKLLDATEDQYGLFEWRIKAELQALKQAWGIRRMQMAGVQMAKTWHPGARLEDVIDGGKEAFASLDSMLASGGGPTSLVDILDGLIAEAAADETPRATKTGIPSFDRMTGGLFPSTLYVIGARPSCGKTAMAVTFGIAAAKAGANVLICSTETTKRIAGARLLAHLTGVDAFKIKDGRAGEPMLKQARAKIPDGLDVYDETPNLHAFLGMMARWRKERVGTPGVVIVDYLEQVRAPRRESREQQISAIIDALHKAGKEYNVAMVVMSQLSRKAEERQNGPTMEDFRYSGMVEQAADVAALLWKPDGSDKDPMPIEIKLAKNKVSGQTGRIAALLSKPESRVWEHEERFDDPFDRKPKAQDVYKVL